MRVCRSGVHEILPSVSRTGDPENEGSQNPPVFSQAFNLIGALGSVQSDPCVVPS